MTDQRLLETLIRYGAPKAEAEALAKSLLRRFGSLAPALESLPSDLARSHGLSDPAARLLHMIPELTRYTALEELKRVTDVGTFRKAGEYLRDLYIGLHNECFYMLCLDARGMLLDMKMIQQGTVDEAPFYLRRILDVAIRSGAHAVVLSHNHPSGTLYPSQGDANCTMLAIEALVPIDVLVLDHVIIADGQPVSIRACGVIPDVLFSKQKPGDPLVAGWYDMEDQS